MASFLRFVRAHSTLTPVMAAAALTSNTHSGDRFDTQKHYYAHCQLPEVSVPDEEEKKDDQQERNQRPKVAGMQPDAQGEFHGMFPMRQLFQPRVEWPLWDKNWDDREPESTGDKDQDRRRMRQIRKQGVTRHIILIRHGQYDETHREDDKRILTPLGRQQAHETGARLAQMLQGIQDDPSSPCNIRIVRVSAMARAKETADIIASHIPDVARAGPDELLNEGRPCHNLPGTTRADAKTIEKTDESHPRIEAAFQKYFYRAPLPDMDVEDAANLDASSPSAEPSSSSKDDSIAAKHEYEIIVCHANVIRYFLCRALQLPPEAWLRLCTFNCSLTYLTIRPTGTVSCRMLGDIGHLPPQMVTFSGHHGFNW